MSPGLVQYIIVNGSIHRQLNWPIGAIIAQCCHAATAVGYLYADDADTGAYYKDLDNMHKVVLEINGEEDMRKLSEKLDTDDIKHKLWIEMPENIPTCLAVKPYQKKSVEKYFKKLKLFR